MRPENGIEIAVSYLMHRTRIGSHAETHCVSVQADAQASCCKFPLYDALPRETRNLCVGHIVARYRDAGLRRAHTADGGV
jgi:hypothetical protein